MKYNIKLNLWSILKLKKTLVGELKSRDVMETDNFFQNMIFSKFLNTLDAIIIPTCF